MLLVMFMLGAVLGNIVVLCMQAASAEFAEKFGMVVSYPVMFIPPMLYASAKAAGMRYSMKAMRSTATTSGNTAASRWP